MHGHCQQLRAVIQWYMCRLKEVPGNWYRLNRVLDILLSTGQTLEELNLDVEAPLDYDFRCFFLNRSRVDLYRRIDARVEDMVCGGLLQVISDAPLLCMLCPAVTL